MPATSSRRPKTVLLVFLNTFAMLTACVSTEDQVRTLQQYNAVSASPSTVPDYDYSVVIRNLEPLGVDMSKVGRERLAVAYLGAKCPDGKVVSETEMATTIRGLGPSDRDYAVRVKC